jgi:hypothetical protein
MLLVNMEKEFVSYEQAVALKELGFNEICMGYFDVRLEHQIGNFDFTEIKGYHESVAALSPLKQQVFRWFREKYNLHYRITYYDPIKAIEFQADYQGFLYKTSAASFDGSLYLPHQSYWKLKDSPYSTYEEAENACIDKLIELAKQQDNG